MKYGHKRKVSIPSEITNGGEPTQRYQVLLPDGSLLRGFSDPKIAAHFSEQVWNIRRRHNKLLDSKTGKVMANFT